MDTNKQSINLSDLEKDIESKIEKLKENLRVNTEVAQTTLSTIAMSEFVPWVVKENQQKKKIYHQKGLLNICNEIFQDKTLPFSIKEAAANVVWNFCETTEFITMVWDGGVFDSVVQLLRDVSAENYSYIDVIVGILMVAIEYNKLDYLSEVCGDLLVTTILNFYQKMSQLTPNFNLLVYTSIVHSLCQHKELGKKLLDNNILDYICKKELRSNLETSYMCCLALGHLLRNHTDILSQNPIALEILSDFVKVVKPLALSQMEEELNFSWNSLFPFYLLTNCPHPLVVKLGLLSLASMSYAKHNRELIVEENLLEEVICFQWLDPKLNKYTNIIINNIGTYQVPSLLTICKFKINKHYQHHKAAMEKYFVCN